MSRHDLAPEDRDRQSLVFSNLVDCPSTVCDEVMEVDFVAEGVYDAEDIPGDLSTTVTCPACGHEFVTEYTGWTVRDEA